MLVNWSETSLRPRNELRFVGSSWPDPVKDQKYSISIGYSDSSPSNSACNRLQQRKDIDCLVLEICTLYEHRKIIDSLLGIKNRDWSVCLQHSDSWSFLEEANDEKLQEALFVLRDVRSLTMGTPVVYGNSSDCCRRLLKNMPNFRNLKSLDLKLWAFTQLDVEDIMDFPFAKQITMVSWSVSFPQLPNLAFSPDVVQRIHSTQICMGHLPVANTVWYVNAVKELPVLRHLHVELPPSGNTEVYVEPINILFRWLENPACPVRILSIRINHIDQQVLVFSVIPKFRTIQMLKLIHDFRQGAANEVLRFQLHSRPRMLMIRLEMVSKKLYPPAAVEKIYHVSRVYQTYQNIHLKKKYQTPLPLSVWSKVLEKLGTNMQVPSLNVRKVCADAMFHTLQRFFLDRWIAERPSRTPPPRQKPPKLPLVAPVLRV